MGIASHKPAPAATPKQGEGNGGAGSTPKKRGRPVETDLSADKCIYDAWKTYRYETYADLERELKMKKGEVKHAIDRHKKRLWASIDTLE
jgi:hypothetical protein